MSLGPDHPLLRDRDALAARLGEAASAASAVLLSLRAAPDVHLKADGSPVCAADLASDRVARERLAQLLPEFPVISEESSPQERGGEIFVLLDPLDGTREFIARGESYCVAIAVVVGDRPVAGAVAAPAMGRLWLGGETASVQPLAPDGSLPGVARRCRVRPLPPEGPTMLVSRFHGDRLSDGVAAALAHGEGIAMSSAVKFCLIAGGEADLHVRGGATMEWDTAGGDAILAAAGGVVRQLDGERPRYGQIGRSYRNLAFVAASSEALAERAIAAAQPYRT